MIENNNSRGAVIWITGYSAAGKTTVGRLVTSELSEGPQQAFFLDGDQLRSIFAHKWGYSNPERVELAQTYFRLCSHLSKQGAIVVISAVAMFDEARAWFRQNIENGLEVYLRVPLDERISRDQRTKHVYADGMASMKDYEEPLDADLIIDNYGKMDVAGAASQIISAFRDRSSLSNVDYGRANHWSQFYSGKGAIKSPSPFAVQSRELMSPGQRILEIGCGNGRDAFYFSAEGMNVTAIDKSPEAIENCLSSDPASSISFLCCDASDSAENIETTFDVVYSRFSLHAMTEPEEDAAISASFQLLNIGGSFLIECRSVNDSLARKGDILSPSERISGHYRRFVVLEHLVDKLERAGFVVREKIESAGLAVYGDEDPIVIRINALKP